MNGQLKRYIGRGLGSERRSFCPCRAGVCHPSGKEMCSTQKLSKPVVQVFLWRHHHVGVINY